MSRARLVKLSDGSMKVDVRMTAFKQKVHRQIPLTPLWGYNGSAPGPLIEVESGTPLRVRWENALPTKHILPVDKTIHGAEPDVPEVRAVVHVHGLRTPSFSDGLPEHAYESGKSLTYTYPNRQRAGTYWYHDHAMGITRLNCAAGLSGMYIVRDEEERRLGLPSGEYEIPLFLQDRMFRPDGSLYYPQRGDVGPMIRQAHLYHGGHGPWVAEYFGDKILVNGVVWPYAEVEPRAYRLRIVNASNSRFYGLRFANGMEFHQIGSDGGLLTKPIALDQVLIAPAERVDLIVDFSTLKGKSIRFDNTANAPFPGTEDATPQVSNVMEFRVTKPLQGKPTKSPLAWSLPFERILEANATVTRDIRIAEEADEYGNSTGLLINGVGYHAPTTEKPKLGSTEIWRFFNMTEDSHPMHVHLGQFQVLDRRPFDLYELLNNKKLEWMSDPQLPAPGERGWKDTVIAYPGEMLRIIMKFEDHKGKFVYHCHMLEHEDNDMMRPFEVV